MTSKTRGGGQDFLVGWVGNPVQEGLSIDVYRLPSISNVLIMNFAARMLFTLYSASLSFIFIFLILLIPKIIIISIQNCLIILKSSKHEEITFTHEFTIGVLSSIKFQKCGIQNKDIGGGCLWKDWFKPSAQYG